MRRSNFSPPPPPPPTHTHTHMRGGVTFLVSVLSLPFAVVSIKVRFNSASFKSHPIKSNLPHLVVRFVVLDYMNVPFSYVAPCF